MQTVVNANKNSIDIIKMYIPLAYLHKHVRLFLFVENFKTRNKRSQFKSVAAIINERNRYRWKSHLNIIKLF